MLLSFLTSIIYHPNQTNHVEDHNNEDINDNNNNNTTTTRSTTSRSLSHLGTGENANRIQQQQPPVFRTSAVVVVENVNNDTTTRTTTTRTEVTDLFHHSTTTNTTDSLDEENGTGQVLDDTTTTTTSLDEEDDHNHNHNHNNWDVDDLDDLSTSRLIHPTTTHNNHHHHHNHNHHNHPFISLHTLAQRLRCLLGTITWPIVPLGSIVILTLFYFLYTAIIVDWTKKCGGGGRTMNNNNNNNNDNSNNQYQYHHNHHDQSIKIYAIGTIVLAAYLPYHALIRDRICLYHYGRRASTTTTDDDDHHHRNNNTRRPILVRRYDQLIHSIALIYVYTGMTIVETCKEDIIIPNNNENNSSSSSSSNSGIDDGIRDIKNHFNQLFSHPFHNSNNTTINTTIISGGKIGMNVCEATCPNVTFALMIYVVALEMFTLSLLIPLLVLPCIYLWYIKAATTTITTTEDEEEEETNHDDSPNHSSSSGTTSSIDDSVSSFHTVSSIVQSDGRIIRSSSSRSTNPDDDDHHHVDEQLNLLRGYHHTHFQRRRQQENNILKGSVADVVSHLQPVRLVRRRKHNRNCNCTVLDDDITDPSRKEDSVIWILSVKNNELESITSTTGGLNRTNKNNKDTSSKETFPEIESINHVTECCICLGDFIVQDDDDNTNTTTVENKTTTTRYNQTNPCHPRTDNNDHEWDSDFTKQLCNVGDESLNRTQQQMSLRHVEQQEHQDRHQVPDVPTSSSMVVGDDDMNKKNNHTTIVRNISCGHIYHQHCITNWVRGKWQSSSSSSSRHGRDRELQRILGVMSIHDDKYRRALRTSCPLCRQSLVPIQERKNENHHRFPYDHRWYNTFTND